MVIFRGNKKIIKLLMHVTLFHVKKRMGEQLINNSASNIFHRQFIMENNIEAFKMGSFSNLKSQQTLRIIKSDLNSIDRFSNDDIIDLGISKTFL